MLFLREWYMHPNGQLPAYEFAFADVNPPVHAWAAWRVYKMTGAARRARPSLPLAHVPEAAHQLHLVGQPQGPARASNLFGGGFLGLDNIGVFDRSQPLPRWRVSRAGRRHGVDGVLLRRPCSSMALELARGQSGVRGRRVQVLRALRRDRRRHEHARRHRAVGRGGRLLLRPAPCRRARSCRLRVRSMVGLIPLFAVRCSRTRCSTRLPGFAKRMRVVPREPPRPGRHVSRSLEHDNGRAACWRSRPGSGSSASLQYVLDESEFLSPHGIRSLSRCPPRAPLRAPARRPGAQGRVHARASRPPGCSAATRTGADRSGSR